MVGLLKNTEIWANSPLAGAKDYGQNKQLITQDPGAKAGKSLFGKLEHSKTATTTSGT